MVELTGIEPVTS